MPTARKAAAKRGVALAVASEGESASSVSAERIAVASKPRKKTVRPDPLPGLVSHVFVCGEVEAWADTQGMRLLIGVDEAGRGPLAGPVVVAACALPYPCPIAGINDSKQLTEEAREALFEPIMQHAIGVGIVVVEHDVIDEMNILRASLHGMALAWEQLVASHPTLRGSVVLIDGKDRAPLPPEVDQRPIIKGDARSHNIAAASILAKVARDRIMRVYHDEYPQYGFNRHKGYPTVEHRAMVERHGPSPIHRRSFNMPRGPDVTPPTSGLLFADTHQRKRTPTQKRKRTPTPTLALPPTHTRTPTLDLTPTPTLDPAPTLDPTPKPTRKPKPRAVPKPAASK